MEKVNGILPNTWRQEFDKWYEESRKDVSSLKRNWGHINFHFALQYFELIEKMKKECPTLYDEYIAKINSSLYFWDLVDMDKCPMLYSEYLSEKHK